jgi:hypothetical protein
LDKTRLTRRLYRQKPEVIKRAAEKVFDKIWKYKEENAKDAVKGFTYGSGMAAPKAAKDNIVDSLAAPKKVVPICPFCEKKGHKTMKTKHCLFSTNKDSNHYKELNEELGTGKCYIQFVLNLLSK